MVNQWFYILNSIQDIDILIEKNLIAANPLALGIIFLGGVITSFGPCSLSLLPVTLAYLAGFENNQQKPWERSIIFSCGIIMAMVSLGFISGMIGQVYGQVPRIIPTVVGTLSILMGFNLLGLIKIPLPAGPDPENWRRKMPPPLAPLGAGLAFGFASSPCITPVLAVLLSWIAQSGQPLTGVLLLACFGAGQVVPLILVGMAAANLPRLLTLEYLSRQIPILSGMIFVVYGTMSLLANWG